MKIFTSTPKNRDKAQFFLQFPSGDLNAMCFGAFHGSLITRCRLTYIEFRYIFKITLLTMANIWGICQLILFRTQIPEFHSEISEKP